MSEYTGPQLAPIEIHSPQGDFLTIDSLGGRVRLVLGNTPILTSVKRGDGKLGETHPCTPIFGPDRNDLFGLSQHGDMRKSLCEVEKEGEDAVIITHDITDSPDRYPQGVKAEQRLSIKDGVFTLRMVHKNAGEKPAPVNAGEHLYFAAPQGYRGVLINGKDITVLIEADTAIPLEAVSTIAIPGLPELALKQEGFNFIMLWVGEDASGQRDGNYVCIEPVEENPSGSYFGSSESMIQPGSSRAAEFSISIKNPKG
jgi:galactose mutarotase-like enzyme